VVTALFKKGIFHFSEHLTELNELRQIDVLNNRYCRATGRLLQLLTEVSIGLAKHWLNSIKNGAVSNAIKLILLYKMLVLFLKSNLLNGGK